MLSLFRTGVGLASRRGLSSQAAAAIPGNLQLADGGRILREVPASENKKVQISEEEFYFPPLHMEVTSLPVNAWMKPGAVAEGSEPAELDSRVFNVAIRKDMVHEMIRFQRAKIRQPHRTKRVGEISGSTRKPHPQKGQGRSQAGNTRNSSWRKGMKAHGPVLRDFSFSLNRKERARALMTVLAAMHRQGDLVVFDSFDMPTNKSKALLERAYEHSLLEKPEKYEDGEIEIAPGRPRRVMLCDDYMSANMVYAARNLQELILMPQVRLNVIDLMRFDALAISSRALKTLQERLIVQHKYGARSMFYLQQQTLFGTSGMLNEHVNDAGEVEE